MKRKAPSGEMSLQVYIIDSLGYGDGEDMRKGGIGGEVFHGLHMKEC